MLVGSRSKNEATVDDVVKICRANLRDVDDRVLGSTDMDKMAQHFEPFLCDLLAVTSRPTCKLLTDAAAVAFQARQEEAKLFGQRIATLVGYIRRKGSGATSGAKLHPSVAKIYRSFMSAPKRSSSRSSLASLRSKESSHSSVKELLKTPAGQKLRATGRRISGMEAAMRPSSPRTTLPLQESSPRQPPKQSQEQPLKPRDFEEMTFTSCMEWPLLPSSLMM